MALIKHFLFRFGQKAHLQKHVITVHRREKPYKCDSCAYQSSTKSTLHKHIAVIHHKDKPFRCQLCPNSTFGQKTHLVKVYCIKPYNV